MSTPLQGLLCHTRYLLPAHSTMEQKRHHSHRHVLRTDLSNSGSNQTRTTSTTQTKWSRWHLTYLVARRLVG